MSAEEQLQGALNRFRMATAEQDGPWSPILAERLDQEADDAAREVARLLLAGARLPDPMLTTV